MRSPTETVKGRITGYDENTGDLIIRARYTDLPTMLRREFKECLIQPIDSRPLSDKQRRACYALLREIGNFTGMGTDPTKEYMKIKFMAEELQETGDKIFSLSNAPMSLVSAFQRFLVRFILDWDIPCAFPLLDFVDDIEDYVYACLAHKKCCVCGKRAELHHHTRIGMGRDRNEIDHEGMPALPLCREHHTECHTMPQKEFDVKYHLIPVKIDKALLRIWRIKGGCKGHDRTENRAD